MQGKDVHPGESDKKLAAVCGLYCQACSLFIATQEDPERLKGIAARYQVSEEAARCYGCRSDKRGPYCAECRMRVCAARWGIDFCIACPEYPCDHLIQFQSERPHRIELREDLERIGAVGYSMWLREIGDNYTCPRCGTMNSAYDLKCRKCGEEPSCAYVAKHKEQIERFLKTL